MLPFLSWYFVLTLLGWLTFPLVFRLFAALPDRGFTLARAAGLLIWGYAFWLLGSLGLARNDLGGILLGLAVLAGLSVWSLVHRPWSMVHDPSSIGDNASADLSQASISNPKSEFNSWIRAHARLIGIVELLFLLAFAFMAVVRATNPEILGTEKPMELMFINSILHSPAFPPHDSWLSGYAISYYYFGYVMTAMLARITAVPGTMAFNLMLALVFGLGAIGAYGILYNLLNGRSSRVDGRSSITDQQSEMVLRPSSMVLSFLAPLFLLIVSNIEGFLEVLHSRGLFWSPDGAGGYVSGFWKWLDVKDLNQAPSQPLLWAPERHWWWWRASRVVQDKDLVGNFQEVIDEFPFFSFLLGDLHPHVLAIPFTLLAVSVALNIFFGGWRGELKLFRARLHIGLEGFAFVALLLGGLAFLNTWDILIAAALIVSAYLLTRVRAAGWSWGRLEEALLFGLPVGVLAILLYLPFYFSFSSQAGGIFPNLINPTRGAHLWMMYSSLFLPLFAFLGYLVVKIRPRWRLALGIAIGLPLLLWGISWALAGLVEWREPGFVAQYLLSQGGLSAALFFSETLVLRWGTIGSLLTLLLLLAPALALILALLDPQHKLENEQLSALSDTELLTANGQPSTFNLKPSNPNAQFSTMFVLLLILLGTLLVLAPEFVYLRDQFGTRMNTVFKFYYQAWLLWGLAASFGIATLLQNLKGAADWIFRVFLVLLLLTALTYPVLSLATKTSKFRPFFGYTLDDFDRVQRETPDEAAAMLYLQTAPYGVVAEAVSAGGSYTGFGRIATYTGLPTLLGWPGHESQWRGGYEPQGTRLEDAETLYTTPAWEQAREIILRYDIRYIVVGGLERSAYPVQEAKFAPHLRVAFQQGDITIYEVPAIP